MRFVTSTSLLVFLFLQLCLDLLMPQLSSDQCQSYSQWWQFPLPLSAGQNASPYFNNDQQPGHISWTRTSQSASASSRRFCTTCLVTYLQWRKALVKKLKALHQVTLQCIKNIHQKKTGEKWHHSVLRTPFRRGQGKTNSDIALY